MTKLEECAKAIAPLVPVVGMRMPHDLAWQGDPAEALAEAEREACRNIVRKVVETLLEPDERMVADAVDDWHAKGRRLLGDELRDGYRAMLRSMLAERSAPAADRRPGESTAETIKRDAAPPV
jgi:hypothetical protein